MTSITWGGTYNCVFCALDAHYCHGCGEDLTHERGDYCDESCRARYLAGNGRLRPCEYPECEEVTYTRFDALCWEHLPERARDEDPCDE